MVEWLPNGRGQTQRILLIFLPNDPRPFLNVTCYRKWRTAAMICWLLLYGATDKNPQEISMSSCMFLDLNAKGIETSGKIKRELKMLSKHHQDNCEREMKVLGRRSKGIIASCLAGTRIDWPKQCWQIGTYVKRKQCFQHHQSIHKPAPPDVVSIATSTSSMKKSRGGACEENRGWGFLDANVGLLGWTPCRWRHWVTWACEAKG